MEAIIAYLQANEESFVQRLSDAVSIKSISASPEHRGECIRQMHESVKLLKSVKATTELVDIGEQKMHDGSIQPSEFKIFFWDF